MKNTLPVCESTEEITYHRAPTPREISFGQGAMHYRDFAVAECCWPGTRLMKACFVASDDGLRYYR